MMKISKNKAYSVQLARFNDYLILTDRQTKWIEASDDCRLTLHNDYLHIESEYDYALVPVANIRSLILKEGELE